MAPTVPRLQHVLPHGAVTRAEHPLAVVTLITWHDGHHTTEDAVAVAWTRSEVLVEWTTPWGTPHQVWVHADHVQRRPAPPSPVTHAE